MMERYGNEKEYNRSLIEAFNKSDEPEIIIVVDKLLTGFDSPRNMVLYLDKSLKSTACCKPSRGLTVCTKARSSASSNT